jgi:hypothetical protein
MTRCVRGRASPKGELARDLHDEVPMKPVVTGFEKASSLPLPLP